MTADVYQQAVGKVRNLGDVRIVTSIPCPSNQSPILFNAISAKHEYTSVEGLYRKAVSNLERKEG
jgi:hypothetical protein